MNERDLIVWGDIVQTDRWIARAREEIDAIDPATECEYETQRAYAWLVHLEDRRERLARMLSDAA